MKFHLLKFKCSPARHAERFIAIIINGNEEERKTKFYSINLKTNEIPLRRCFTYVSALNAK